MRTRLTAALGTFMLMASGSLTVASPVAAAQDSTGTSGPYEMPEVKAMTLQKAVDSVLAVTGDADLNLQIQNRKDVREVINYTNWEVCGQWPSGGSEISQKSMRVVLVVRRPNTSGCW